MGMNLNTELTIYFEIDPALKVPVFVDATRCRNTDCHNHLENMGHKGPNFCGECGSATEACQFLKGRRSPSASDFCDAVFNDEDFLTDHHEGLSETIWVYNRHHGPTKDLSSIMDLGGALDMSTLSGEAIMAEAIENDPQLGRVIDEFNRHFGIPKDIDDAIGMKFGLIGYYA